MNFRLGLIRGLRRAGYEIVVAAPADGHAQKLVAEGVRFLPLPMTRSGMNPVKELRLLTRYGRLMREVRPAVYLGFTIKPNIYGSLAAATTGVPSINNVSGLGTMFLGGGGKAALARALYRLALRRSATVFFQNPEDLQSFVDSGTVRHGQARLLPGSGIDLDHYAPAPLPEGAPVFLFAGRLLADKGVREFVAAARLARDGVPGARFQLLGAPDPGNPSNIPEAQLDAWRTDGTVELLGEASDVRPHIARATAVVLPSYREGLPRVLLEAAAMGRPMIASDVPGCRTIVEPGNNGLLCSVRDPRSLADAMIEIAELSHGQRQAMGRAARATVERDYGEERVIEAYLEALREIEAPFRVGGP